MTGVKRLVYLKKSQWDNLYTAIREQGFEGRGSVNRFLRMIADKKNKIIVIRKDETIKVKIEKEDP